MCRQSFTLEGRTAVVTGGYGVLGGSKALGLAQAGAKVVVLGRRRAKAESKAEAIRASGDEAQAFVADVRSDCELRAVPDEIEAG